MTQITSASKACKTCGDNLPISAFRVSRTKEGKLSVRGSCKKCEAEKQRKWRKDHPDQNKTYMKKYLKTYYQDNKEDLTQYKKEYYQDNKEQYKTKNHVYYGANKDTISKQGSDYYQKNKEHIKDRNKSWREINKEHCSEYKKGYYAENKDALREYKRTWYTTPNGRASNTKHACKRRCLGFNPMNKKFIDSVYHHLRYTKENGEVDNDIGVYIPVKLHESIKHDGNKGTGMKKINVLALKWYLANTHLTEIHPIALKLLKQYA